MKGNRTTLARHSVHHYQSLTVKPEQEHSAHVVIAMWFEYFALNC